MKFTFKRKYTLTFFVCLILIGLSISFFFFGPRFIDRDTDFFYQVLWISLADILLITIFVLGMYRVNYYLYHDHLEIRRSLLKNINLNYNEIKELKEFPNDSIFLIFGKRPSFKVKYLKNNKIKSYRIRLNNPELFKLVMENENKIHISKNN